MCFVEKCGEICHVDKFTLFCREIRFVAIYAPLCGEELNQKLCLWREKDKYQVCTSIPSLSMRAVTRLRSGMGRCI